MLYYTILEVCQRCVTPLLQDSALRREMDPLFLQAERFFFFFCSALSGSLIKTLRLKVSGGRLLLTRYVLSNGPWSLSSGGSCQTGWLKRHSAAVVRWGNAAAASQRSLARSFGDNKEQNLLKTKARSTSFCYVWRSAWMNGWNGDFLIGLQSISVSLNHGRSVCGLFARAVSNLRRSFFFFIALYDCCFGISSGISEGVEQSGSNKSPHAYFLFSAPQILHSLCTFLYLANAFLLMCCTEELLLLLLLLLHSRLVPAVAYSKVVSSVFILFRLFIFFISQHAPASNRLPVCAAWM